MPATIDKILTEIDLDKLQPGEKFQLIARHGDEYVTINVIFATHFVGHTHLVAEHDLPLGEATITRAVYVLGPVIAGQPLNFADGTNCRRKITPSVPYILEQIFQITGPRNSSPFVHVFCPVETCDVRFFGNPTIEMTCPEHRRRMRPTRPNIFPS